VIFLVEDEPVLARSIAEFLVAAGEHVESFGDAESALAAAQASPPDAIVADLQLPGMGGLQLLSEVARMDPAIVRIAMTAHASVQSAVLAMRGGCYEYLEKPLDLQQLHRVVSRALAQRRASTELAWLRGGRTGADGGPAVLGESKPIASVRKQIEALARAGLQAPPVLLAGETGVGKGLVARAIHAARMGADAAWIEVNCAALPGTLAEAELFGYERSAFTDAKHAKPSLFEAASGGTIFLDEVGEMELAVQAKLLRLIQDGELYPVGEETPTKIDVRILAATNRNLEREVAGGRFRADLYWRLNVIPVEMPSLRTRPTDIIPLAEHFVIRANERHKRQVIGFDEAGLGAMRTYAWPGNIRELENVIERLVIVKGSGMLTLADLPPAIRNPRDVTPLSTPMPELPKDGTDLRAMLEAVEERMIGEALERTGGNKNRAAELLGLNRTTLVEKLRRKRVSPQF
jgi:DNA-binding NtrC family response regulator